MRMKRETPRDCGRGGCGTACGFAMLSGGDQNMKDAIYVVFAAIGLVLVGAGLSQVQESVRAKPRSNDLPAAIESLFSQKSCCRSREQLHRYGMVPADDALLFAARMATCCRSSVDAVYAQNRGRVGRLRPLGLAVRRSVTCLLALCEPRVIADELADHSTTAFDHMNHAPHHPLCNRWLSA